MPHSVLNTFVLDTVFEYPTECDMTPINSAHLYSNVELYSNVDLSSKVVAKRCIDTTVQSLRYTSMQNEKLVEQFEVLASCASLNY